MAKVNLSFTYGRVSKKPIIKTDKKNEDNSFAMVYLEVVRGPREVGDDLRFLKHDYPLVIAREKESVEEMSTWEENDIVQIKGVITTKKMEKSSYCPNCTGEDDNPTKNTSLGNILYITPIFLEKIKSYGDDKDGSIKDIVEHREISNQVYLHGTLIREPKIFTTKNKKQITQYPVAVNRKYLIRTDAPEIKTDWPIVKSYGEQARDDKMFLQMGAEIIVDGFLQARTVERKTKCACCGKIYPWKDHAMEVVPYAVEYVSGYKSVEQVEAEAQKTVEEIKQKLYNDGMCDDFDEENDENLKSTDLN